MTEKKIDITNCNLGIESFGFGQQLRPETPILEKSFTGASGLAPGLIASASNPPVNSATAPVPIPTKTNG